MGDRFFSIETPRSGAGVSRTRTGGAEGPGGCLQRIGESGEGLNIFFRDQNVHQDNKGFCSSGPGSRRKMTKMAGVTHVTAPRVKSTDVCWFCPLAATWGTHCLCVTKEITTTLAHALALGMFRLLNY